MGNSLIPLPQNSKLTRTTIKKLEKLLAKGNTDQVACAGSSIAESTFYEWMALGRELLSRADFTPESEYDRNAMELVEAVTRARGKAEELAVAAVQNAIIGYDSEEVTIEQGFREVDGKLIEIEITKTKTWHTAPDARIALEFLARKNPADWGRKADIEINNTNNTLVVSADDIQSAVEQAFKKRNQILRDYPELTDGDT